MNILSPTHYNYKQRIRDHTIGATIAALTWLSLCNTAMSSVSCVDVSRYTLDAILSSDVVFTGTTRKEHYFIPAKLKYDLNGTAVQEYRDVRILDVVVQDVIKGRVSQGQSVRVLHHTWCDGCDNAQIRRSNYKEAHSNGGDRLYLFQLTRDHVIVNTQSDPKLYRLSRGVRYTAADCGVLDIYGAASSAKIKELISETAAARK